MEVADARLKNRIVLIIEDDWLLRQSLSASITEAGGKVIETSTGEYAIALLTQNQPIDLLITDIQLAGTMNGWDVAEFARYKRPAMPIIYTSGIPPLEDRHVSESVFLSKPCSSDTMLDMCAGMLSVS